MAQATTSRWARRTVAVGVVALPVWQTAVLLGAPSATTVALGLLGFVLHVALGKAAALVPSHFDRDLAVPHAPAVSLPLTAVGAAGVAVGGLPTSPPVVGALGATCWTLGVAAAVGTLAWTVRDNPTGRETGTSDANAERRSLDRYANAFVPIALLYLLVGSYALLAGVTPLPTVVDGSRPGAVHLLAAGGAGLLVLAVGSRLLPRFLVVRPWRPPLLVALPAGAVGPALIAAGLPAGPWFRIGAAAEAAAIIAFAASYLAWYVRSDRRRVALRGPLFGVLAGAVAVGVGAWFAIAGVEPTLAVVHRRLNLLGFLGLTVVGLTVQFYPPAVGTVPGSSDRGAAAILGLLAGGLAVEVGGLATGLGAVVVAGRLLALAGAGWYAVVLLSLFRER
jgi:hypothetical protein